MTCQECKPGPGTFLEHLLVTDLEHELPVPVSLREVLHIVHDILPQAPPLLISLQVNAVPDQVLEQFPDESIIKSGVVVVIACPLLIAGIPDVPFPVNPDKIGLPEICDLLQIGVRSRPEVIDVLCGVTVPDLWDSNSPGHSLDRLQRHRDQPDEKH